MLALEHCGGASPTPRGSRTICWLMCRRSRSKGFPDYDENGFGSAIRRTDRRRRVVVGWVESARDRGGRRRRSRRPWSPAIRGPSRSSSARNTTVTASIGVRGRADATPDALSETPTSRFYAASPPGAGARTASHVRPRACTTRGGPPGARETILAGASQEPAVHPFLPADLRPRSERHRRKVSRACCAGAPGPRNRGPDEFNPDRRGVQALIVPIGRWVARTGLTAGVGGNAAGRADRRLGVNVSRLRAAPRSLREGRRRTLLETGLRTSLRVPARDHRETVCDA